MPAVLIFGFVIVIGLLYAQSAKASCGCASCTGSKDTEGCGYVNPDGSTNGFAINNPGNIRWIENPSARWLGMISNHNGYGVFDTLQNGVRAIGKQLTVDYNRGNNTVRKIISVWAPASENLTDAYIADVSQRINIAPDDPLEPFQDILPDLTAAIIIHENGRNTIDTGDLLTYLNS